METQSPKNFANSRATKRPEQTIVSWWWLVDCESVHERGLSDTALSDDDNLRVLDERETEELCDCDKQMEVVGCGMR